MNQTKVIEQNNEMDIYIKKYYEISKFINKYILVLGSFILSLLLTLLFSFQDSPKILAYTTSDINLKSLSFKTNIGIEPMTFNKRSKYIKASILFNNSKIYKDGVELSYGVFRDNKGFYYPNNLYIKNKDYEKLMNGKNIEKKYTELVLKSKSLNNKFKIIKIQKLTDSDVLSEYNLDCMNSMLSNTTFCDYNKKLLLEDLMNTNKDISVNMYKKLFDSLSLGDDTECKILQDIFFKKYNYKNISSLVTNKCDSDISSYIEDAYNIYNIYKDGVFKATKKEFTSKLVFEAQLINQFKEIIKGDKISNDNALITIELINQGINNLYFDNRLASLSIYILNNYLKPKVSGKDVLSKINIVINGDDINKGLNSFVNKTENSSNPSLISVPGLGDKEIVSNAEQFTNLVLSNYSDKFIIEGTPTLTNKDKLLVKGQILFTYKTSAGKIVKKSLKIRFYTNKILYGKFNVLMLHIDNKKVSDYLGNIKVNFKSFDELYSYLKNNLEGPFAYNDWSNGNDTGGIHKLSLCEKIKIKYKGSNIKCSKNRIFLKGPDLDLKGKIFVILYPNDNFKITKIKAVNGNAYLLLNNSLFTEKIKITKLDIKAVNSLLSKELEKSNKKISYAIKMVKKVFDNLRNIKVKSLVGLPSDKVDDISMKIREYFGTDLKLIRKKQQGIYYLYFKLDNLLIKAEYSYSKNTILAIQLLYDWKSKPEDGVYIIKNVNLKLSKTNLGKLNEFKLDPLNYLKNIDSNTIEEYLSHKK